MNNISHIKVIFQYDQLRYSSCKSRTHDLLPPPHIRHHPRYILNGTHILDEIRVLGIIEVIGSSSIHKGESFQIALGNESVKQTSFLFIECVVIDCQGDVLDTRSLEQFLQLSVGAYLECIGSKGALFPPIHAGKQQWENTESSHQICTCNAAYTYCLNLSSKDIEMAVIDALQLFISSYIHSLLEGESRPSEHEKVGVGCSNSGHHRHHHGHWHASSTHHAHLGHVYWIIGWGLGSIHFTELILQSSQ